MKKIFFISAFMLSLLVNSFAQPGFNLIDSAKLSFCNHDTLAAIKYLKQYSEKYPDYINTLIVNNRIAEFYISLKDYKKAIEILTASLELEPKTGYPFKENDNCKIFIKNDFSSAKAEICVSLSQLYQQLGEYDKGIDYLTLADSKHLPTYGGCANGMIMYRTYLSLYFADLYLKTGDTVKAENRLIQYFLSGEDYSAEVAQKLKEVLLLRYSKMQINTEIENAISNIVLTKKNINGEEVNFYTLNLFGNSFQLPFDTLEANKVFISLNRNFGILKG